jgi:class 3 adenylate cyclase/pimeloyl-ACP methyl ester carboxylesterase
MDQKIRLCTTTDGIRIAYAAVGDGPPFVVPPGWISHLELEWEQPALRAFFETVAHHHTVVRYDKYGCGLSDRDRTTFTLDQEVQIMETVVDHLKLKRMALFSVSQAGPVAIGYAVRHPRRVSHLILYGTWARRDSIANDALRSALIPLIRAHWGIGSKALADAFLPGANSSVGEWFARLQRESATPEVAAELIEFGTRLDVADLVPRLRVPTLVLHRRGDLMVPFRLGRELAALTPGARFIPLEGAIHRPYFGDAESVLRAIAEFLEDPLDRPTVASAPKSEVGKPPAARRGPAPQRVLATVLFMDIVGSTERAAALGDQRWGALLERYRALTRKEIGRYGGREVDTAGDGVLAVFDAPARAIGCACAVSKMARELTLDVRAGLHTGECEITGAGLIGIAVHIGARIAALASAGEVLVSNTVKDLAAGSGFRFEGRGVHTLKGVPGEWSVFLARSG